MSGYVDLVVTPKMISGIEPYVDRYMELRAPFYGDADAFKVMEDIDRENSSEKYVRRKRGFFANLVRCIRGRG